MAKTTSSDVIIREVFDEAVEGAFAQKTALMGSMLAATGAAVIAGDLPENSPSQIGNKVNIPYFGVIGDFQQNVGDGVALTPAKLSQGQEQGTIQRSGLAFEISDWARSSVGKDIYEEGAAQVVKAAEREMDRQLVVAATAAGGLALDKYSASSPRTMDYELVVDGRALWGDEQGDIVAMMVRSKVYADMLKLKDAVGRPLLTMGDVSKGEFDRFVGIPVGVSDRLPVTTTYGTPVSAGTSPPVLTIAGTANAAHDLKIKCTLGGAHGTAKIAFSTDGGQNYSADILTHATPGTAQNLTDTTIDSIVGLNGLSGLTFAFAAGTFNVDQTWTVAPTGKHTSLLVKSQSLAFWYNKAALKLETDRDILAHTSLAALHLYSVAYRYKRRRGSYRSGIVKLQHN